MSDFFQKDYDIPNDSKYMKFEEGENVFRILGSFADGTAIMGTELWVTKEDGKRYPKRFKMGEAVPVSDIEVNPKTGEEDLPKHFWAVPVYNYATKTIQVLEITQKSIMNPIKAYADNPKWGNPKNYDFIVTRTKENGKTSYSVTVNPKEKLDEGILTLYKDLKLNLGALYDGGDPFQEASSVDINDIPENL